ncbi:MAG: Na-K-Cl cotransporter, partial [Cyanobacteria bacterium P01_H01_bin.121]
AILISLVSFGLGHTVSSQPLGLQLPVVAIPSTEIAPFWTVFAVFFPAVTGIMAGVGMSGNLQKPEQAIPRGTLGAIGAGYLIYMALPFLLAFRADAATLRSEPLVMQQIALWGPGILLGVWGSTLSSAMGSLLGAPRVLQALAMDQILPEPLKWLGRESGPEREPRAATLVTLVFVLVAIIAGDLDQIAPILTMFFLTTYMMLNVTAGIEGLLASPSFRPAFRVHWSLSFAGAIGCLGVMFLINVMATLVAAVIAFSIYIWLERRGLQSTWGDTRRGIWFALVRFAMLRLMDSQPDARNWRPSILVLSGAPTRRWPLIGLASAFTHNRSFITIASILPGQTTDLSRQQSLETTIQDYLDRKNVQGVVRLLRANDPFQGAVQLVEAYGFGPIYPNTVMLGDSEDATRRESYCNMLSQIHKANRNLVILRDEQNRGFPRYKQIDIWWGGLQANGGLMLLLAHLLKTSQAWKYARITLKLVVPTESACQTTQTNLEPLVQRLRIDAKLEILVSKGRSFDVILHDSSQTADLVFLGMATPKANFVEYYESLRQRTQGLPPTLLVLASKDTEFTEILAPI